MIQSLKKLQAMIEEAKGTKSRVRSQREIIQEHYTAKNPKFREKRRRSCSPLGQEDSKRLPSYESHSKDNDCKRHSDREQDRNEQGRQDRYYDQREDRYYHKREDRYLKSSEVGTRDDEDKKFRSSFVRPADDFTDSSDSRQRMFLKPKTIEGSSPHKNVATNSSSSSLKKKFAKPGDSDENEQAGVSRREKERLRDSGFKGRPVISAGWKKQEFHKPEKSSNIQEAEWRSGSIKRQMQENAQSSSSSKF